MSRIFRGAIAGLIVVLLFELGVRLLGPALPRPSTWREPLVQAKVDRMDGLSHGGGVDVVLAGSSHVLFAADPSLLRRELDAEWTVYNTALWGSPLVVTEHWLTEVSVPRLRPRTVLLGVSPVDFSQLEDRVVVRSYFDSPAVRDDVLGRLERYAADGIALVRHRREIRRPSVVVSSVARRVRGESAPASEPVPILADGRISRYDAVADVREAIAGAIVAAIEDEGLVMYDVHETALARTIRSLRRRSIDVVVIEMPVEQSLIETMREHDRGYDSYRAFVRRVTTSLGVPLLDIAADVTDPRFFLDPNHVNEAGRAQFTRALARRLKSGEPGSFARIVADR